MATAPKRKRKPPVSGKAAVNAEVLYRLKVKAKQRYHEIGFSDESGRFDNVTLLVDQIGDNVRIQPEDCETQIETTLPTLRAMMVELEKKIEVK